MDLSAKKKGKSLVVRASGRMDAVAAPQFDSGINKFINDGELDLVVDMSGVDYISSGGLRSVLIVTKNMKTKGGRICFCEITDPVKKVLAMSGLAPLIPSVDSVDQAVNRP